jgi:hypothetical protein
MAELQIGAEELRPLVQAIIAEVLGELERKRTLLNGRLAVTEAEAADLLGLHSWQLRDLRLAGKIGYSRIVGGRVRYTVDDLLDYLRQGHEKGQVDSQESSCGR